MAMSQLAARSWFGRKIQNVSLIFLRREAAPGYIKMGMRVFSGTAGTSSFNEIALPELPTPKLPKNATGSEPDTARRVDPFEWNERYDCCPKMESALRYAY